MALISLKDVSLGFGGPLLLDGIDLYVERGEWIGLLGRNGMGKTTLLKVISGAVVPDSGERWLRSGTRIAYLDQDLPHADDQDVYDVIAHGLSGSPRVRHELGVSGLQPLGEIDPDELLIEGVLDPGLPPAISPLKARG